MTGNLVFLGLRAAGSAIAPDAINVCVSLAGFAAGVYVTTRIARPSKDSNAWPRVTTVALGVSLIPHACFVAVWLACRGQPSPQTIPALLGLWAIAMGSQSAAVRSLNVAGVFTTAATATFIFLAGDLADWSSTRPEHRRLGGVLVSLFLGAAAGGVLVVRAAVYAPLLPLAITLGVVAAAGTMLRRGDGGIGTRA
jgi:uncharacterized membrane protein YoaK (UPF0700 family)